MLTQGKDDDKEKWQNSRREACYTLSIEGSIRFNKISLPFLEVFYKNIYEKIKEK